MRGFADHIVKYLGTIIILNNVYRIRRLTSVNFNKVDFFFGFTEYILHYAGSLDYEKNCRYYRASVYNSPYGSYSFFENA